MDVKNSFTIVHVFNSSSVSGPESLVIPALPKLGIPTAIIFLTESRLPGSECEPVDFARARGCTVFTVPVGSRIDAAAIAKLRSILAETSAKLVHAHDVKASLYSWLAARALNLKLISTHHGIHGRPDWKTKVYELFYRWFILRFFAAVVAVSTSDYRDLRRSLLPESKLHLIFNGITKPIRTLAERRELSAQIRLKWLGRKLPEKTQFLGVVGRLAAEKNCSRILRVAKILNEILPSPWKLLFFGSGNLETKLHAESLALGLKERVEWLGHCPGISDEILGLDVLISLSKAEGMPISMIEAGWAGTPVFATRVGGVIDLIPTLDIGTTVDPRAEDSAIAAQLQQLLIQPELLQRQGKSFQSLVIANFSESKWLEAHLKLYRVYLIA